MPIAILRPAANALFNIDATPRMPAISCQARITGVQPDPTTATAFDWSIHAVTDMTRRITKGPDDEITEMVDAEHRTLWIALNGNTHSASCYAYDLHVTACDSTFFEDLMRRYDDLGRNAPQPSISPPALDQRQAIVGFFKGGVYLYSIEGRQYRLVYTPSSAYNWAVGAVLTHKAGLVATRGDGLIVIDRVTGTARRFPDRPGNPIRTVAVSGATLYIGARGVYQAPVAAIAGEAPSPPRRFGCWAGGRP